MTAQQLLNQAIHQLNNLQQGEIFLVKDLFTGYLWNRESKAERLMLGTLFLNYARQNPSQIQILKKLSSNQQKYQKL